MAQLTLKLLVVVLVAYAAMAEEAKNETKTPKQSPSSSEDSSMLPASNAEFRQAGAGQQLLSASAYPSVYGNGYQFLTGAGASSVGSSGGYGGMLRQLYRPSSTSASFGLTDKVRNWVKSFLNRRQYVKPYYNPGSMLSGYGGLEEGKPVYINGASYKPVAVPLRQLQKYFKPFYGLSAASPSAAAAESAAAQSAMAQYLAAAAGQSPPRGQQSFSGSFGSASDSGLYASETSASLFNPSSGSASLFSAPSGSSQLFSVSNPSSGGPASFGSSGSAFGQGSSLYGSSGLYGAGSSLGSSSSGLGSSSGGSLYGSSGGLYGLSSDDLVSSSSSLYSASSGNSPFAGGAGYGSGRQSEASYSFSGPSADSGYSFDQVAGGYPAESSYSVTYQRPPQQSQNSFDVKSKFQPVSFGSNSNSGGFKAIAGGKHAGSNSGSHGSGPQASVSSSTLYVSEKSS